MTDKTLPRIVVTGASGFIGRNFVETYKNDFEIFAIARRSQQEVGLQRHKNITWFLADVAERESIHEVMDEIIAGGGADYFIHLAAFFDFSNEPNEEYERTNVRGSKIIFEAASGLGLKRFIFASSLVVSEFPEHGDRLTEQSSLDADFPYAVTKIAGEAMAKEWSETYPCTVVRFAAVFSDWCEYGPLYKFLDTWSSGSWKSNVLGGNGNSAVPYIHIKCLGRLLRTILDQTDRLKPFDVFVASPDASSSHQELYDLSTRFVFGETRKAIHMPVALARLGVIMLDLLGRMVGHRPFERPWMMKYIDQRMEVDAAYTRKALNWNLYPRHTLERRILHVIEHMKTFPIEWHHKNSLALYKSPDRPNLKIAETLAHQESSILTDLQTLISDPENRSRFLSYQKMEPEKLAWYLGILYNLLKVSVRTGDRLSMANYGRFIASIRIHEGFKLEEVVDVYQSLSNIVIQTLLEQSSVRDLEQRIRDDIDLTIQMAIDEIEDAYDIALAPASYTRFQNR
ncbi:MAG: NAD(P)-dependent oxidoreductase [Candidatus Marinimicrobia bacterium]|nr:NAD(P)-dependent oxidoreductase [Candidatus Neomarinimicrobiota bacterium]MBT3630756.1 NAD(P)-dependent oxidoreductase [Candidatus Neomarinimicrobiota bacterium]MBT3823893.1 NAD(P)-dependent oxidoreductase [Candidatus Neomarinimicrobiota bacterium]MBT4130310.1 NAD(P)-dependent oxidoreductase [Candidatus Neomarinimicrobiota bacterium]MBT4295143.1 NAD(P)-dependent oxidoreductase [Candidatus Neomarinimicrobiota bacterium]